MPRTLADYQPEWREGLGVNSLISINVGAANATATKVWKHTVDANTPASKGGHCFRLTYLDAIVGAGTGVSGGNWVFTINVNGVAITTLTIASNATDLYGSKNLRDSVGSGIGLKPGDVITIDITTVPTTAGTLAYPYAVINLGFQAIHASA